MVSQDDVSFAIPAKTMALLLLFLTPSAVWGQLTRQDLSSSIRNAIRHDEVAFDNPLFKYDYKSGILGYQLGGRKEGAVRDRTILDYPTNLQFQIELIRIDRHDALDFWKPYLKRLETIVDGQLAAIANNRGKKNLVKRLSELDDRAKDVFMEAIEASAKETGLKPEGLAGVDGLCKVRFSVIPEGGKVYYITRFDYHLAKKAGVEENISSWRQPENVEEFIPAGNYYFCAKWALGKSTVTEEIRITNDKTVSLSPDR
jgi:hypothetical protein